METACVLYHQKPLERAIISIATFFLACNSKLIQLIQIDYTINNMDINL